MALTPFPDNFKDPKNNDHYMGLLKKFKEVGASDVPDKLTQQLSLSIKMSRISFACENLDNTAERILKLVMDHDCKDKFTIEEAEEFAKYLAYRLI